MSVLHQLGQTIDSDPKFSTINEAESSDSIDVSVLHQIGQTIDSDPKFSTINETESSDSVAKL